MCIERRATVLVGIWTWARRPLRWYAYDVLLVVLVLVVIAKTRRVVRHRRTTSKTSTEIRHVKTEIRESVSVKAAWGVSMM